MRPALLILALVAPLPVQAQILLDGPIDLSKAKRSAPADAIKGRSPRPRSSLAIERYADLIAAGDTLKLDALPAAEKAATIRSLFAVVIQNQIRVQTRPSLSQQRREEQQANGQLERTRDEAVLEYIRQYALGQLRSQSLNSVSPQSISPESVTPEHVREAARMLMTVGQTKDLPEILESLEFVLEVLGPNPKDPFIQAGKRPFYRSDYENQARMLIVTTRTLMARGAALPSKYNGTAVDLAIDLAPRYLAISELFHGSLILERPYQAPFNWRGGGEERTELALANIQNRHPYISELALTAFMPVIPMPAPPNIRGGAPGVLAPDPPFSLPGAVREALPKLITSEWEGVRKAAFRLIEASNDKNWLPLLLSTIDATPSAEIAGRAVRAAQLLGETVALWEVLLGRFQEPAFARLGLWSLAKIFGKAGFYGQIEDDTELPALQEKWLGFVKANRNALREGKRFQLTDPEVPPGLIPTGMKLLPE